ncbi:hypothetical protein BBK82_10735 [Lentzea guizhouensis]|uniref:Uncharacterized protein n=1 Tax=Lentzea guizhouensis TaxID=1586287 RepID=A0A1B2HFH1_9PSEU|nr:hypothetical protein [Lentzea guizhouensis]ANZ36471.1 hypothetical protein BBK82_10735 [Lentzea guizhouensis]
MKDLLIGGAVAMFVLLIAYAGYKAITATTKQQQDAAYRVLKLVLATLSGVAVVTLAVLHQAGVV